MIYECILVLDGAGYIGSHTVYELIAVGENVVKEEQMKGKLHSKDLLKVYKKRTTSFL